MADEVNLGSSACMCLTGASVDRLYSEFVVSSVSTRASKQIIRVV